MCDARSCLLGLLPYARAGWLTQQAPLLPVWRLRCPRARSLQVGTLACRRPPSHSRERRERLGQADKERGERERGETGQGQGESRDGEGERQRTQ